MHNFTQITFHLGKSEANVLFRDFSCITFMLIVWLCLFHTFKGRRCIDLEMDWLNNCLTLNLPTLIKRIKRTLGSLKWNGSHKSISNLTTAKAWRRRITTRRFRNTSQWSCAKFPLYSILLQFGTFLSCPRHSGLLHWYWNNMDKTVIQIRNTRVYKYDITIVKPVKHALGHSTTNLG